MLKNLINPLNIALRLHFNSNFRLFIIVLVGFQVTIDAQYSMMMTSQNKQQKCDYKSIAYLKLNIAGTLCWRMHVQLVEYLLLFIIFNFQQSLAYSSIITLLP